MPNLVLHYNKKGRAGPIPVLPTLICYTGSMSKTSVGYLPPVENYNNAIRIAAPAAIKELIIANRTKK